MSTDTSADHYQESLRLLLELHELTTQGQDESPPADAIREEMEQHWYPLSPLEQQRITGLSADLYSIGVDRTEPVNDPPEELSIHISSLTSHEKWDDLLIALREDEDILPPDNVALYRGISWGYLNYPKVALIFFEEAARLDPANPNKVLPYTLELIHADDYDTAMQVVDAALMIQPNLAEMLCFKGWILLHLSAQLSGQLNKDQLHQVLKLEHNALELMIENPPELEYMPQLAQRTIGMCYHLLGQKFLARKAYKEALAMDEEDEIARDLLKMLDGKEPMQKVAAYVSENAAKMIPMRFAA